MPPAVATDYTLEFITKNLPDGVSKVLEVGCGEGEVAARLAHSGFMVVALDSDKECVARAQSSGLDARLIEWPVDLGEAFDAVVFTRSLHHIDRLHEAIAAAVQVLCPGGRIIVEDFRAEGGADVSHHWFAELVGELAVNGVFRSGFDPDAMIAKYQPDKHGHELHSSVVIGEALARFGKVEAGDAAYYFRYLEPELRSETDARLLLDKELQAIAAGEIDALGKRFVLAPTR